MILIQLINELLQDYSFKDSTINSIENIINKEVNKCNGNLKIVISDINTINDLYDKYQLKHINNIETINIYKYNDRNSYGYNTKIILIK